MDKQKEKKRINGKDLLLWFHSGVNEVVKNKKYLNSINVFPIPDGDTGTNLATTVTAMVRIPLEDNQFSTITREMSESALANARGNSGILFAAYISGLAVEGKAYQEVTTNEFSSIAYKAVNYLYQAVENPLEGTMITVIKDWASFLQKNCQKYEVFYELFQEAYKEAKKSLQKTKTQLAVLKKNDLVDSGADGFVKFLKGINHYFDENDMEEEAIVRAPGKFVLDEEDIEVESYRYCTEVYISFEKVIDDLEIKKNEEKIKRELKQFGNSLIVSIVGEHCRVHIHTDHPEKVVIKAREIGKILEQKVDDMYLQNSTRTNPISKIGILTDSIGDIPDDMKKQYQIHTLPLGVLVDESVYLDKLTIKAEQLFELQKSAKEYPTSSQPQPFRVQVLLESLLESYESLIVITVSSKMSGTYHTLKKAALSDSLKDKKITVIDSRLNSGAQGLLVKAAAQMRQKNYSHDEIVNAVIEMIPNTKIYVCLNTLEYAVKSGRVPDRIGKIGMKIGMRPIMTIDREGNGTAFGVAFSQKKITKKILSLIKNKAMKGEIDAYSIVHAGNEKLAQEYSRLLTLMIGKEPDYICEISAIVAMHSGKGSVALCFTQKVER